MLALQLMTGIKLGFRAKKKNPDLTICLNEQKQKKKETGEGCAATEIDRS